MCDDMSTCPGSTKYLLPMIEGHGDDAYRYDHISVDFSSNICHHGGHGALMEHLAGRPDLVAHYPEPEAWSLEAQIAERHHLHPRQVIVTSGATEAIYLIAQAFRWQPTIQTPTFSEYEDACAMYPYEKHTEKVLWLCNPNNPTGEVCGQKQIEEMLAQYDLVVIDQSYENYTGSEPVSPQWAVAMGCVVQIHSLTKTYAVPGLRLGYITASSPLAETIRSCMRPWSVSALAIEAGRYLLQHDELRCKPDLAEAQRLRRNLMETGGVDVLPTQTNFMLCRLCEGTAAELKDYLARRHGMLIRDASNFRGLGPRHFRVAAQTPQENDRLVAAIQQYFLQCTK